jgi:hypothetical protein
MASDQPSDGFSGFDDPESGIWTSDGTGATVISFGGIVNNPKSDAKFEFFRFFDQLPYRKIFVRDLDQCWYQRGVRGLGTNLTESVEALRPLVAAADGPVIAVGASAGGYAAMVLGTLLGAHRCLAFSPQSNLTRSFRARHLDLRWRHQIRRMRSSPQLAHLDVRSVTRTTTPIEVYFARSHRLDAVHARELQGAAGVSLTARAGEGHNVVRQMRESGELADVVDRIASGRG